MENSPDFQKQVDAYETELTSRKSTGSIMPGQVLTLKQMDKLMNEAVKEVKLYI